MKYFKIKKIYAGRGLCYLLGTVECIVKKYTCGCHKSLIAYRRNDSAVYIYFIFIRKRGLPGRKKTITKVKRWVVADFAVLFAGYRFLGIFSVTGGVEISKNIIEKMRKGGLFMYQGLHQLPM